MKMAANLNLIEKIIRGFAIRSVQEQGLLGHEYCRLTKKKVLDCKWHKKWVIEFKFMKKPRAICMSSRLRSKGYIISIFVDGNAFVFFRGVEFRRVEYASISVVDNSKILEVLKHAAKQYEFYMGIAIFL